MIEVATQAMKILSMFQYKVIKYKFIIYLLSYKYNIRETQIQVSTAVCETFNKIISSASPSQGAEREKKQVRITDYPAVQRRIRLNTIYKCTHPQVTWGKRRLDIFNTTNQNRVEEEAAEEILRVSIHGIGGAHNSNTITLTRRREKRSYLCQQMGIYYRLQCN